MGSSHSLSDRDRPGVLPPSRRRHGERRIPGGLLWDLGGDRSPGRRVRVDTLAGPACASLGGSATRRDTRDRGCPTTPATPIGGTSRQTSGSIWIPAGHPLGLMPISSGPILVSLPNRVPRGRLADLLDRARHGQRVELGCLGGHGRTGTALAWLAVLAGELPDRAVSWVRKNFSPTLSKPKSRKR